VQSNTAGFPSQSVKIIDFVKKVLKILRLSLPPRNWFGVIP